MLSPLLAGLADGERFGLDIVLDAPGVAPIDDIFHAGCLRALEQDTHRKRAGFDIEIDALAGGPEISSRR